MTARIRRNRLRLLAFGTAALIFAGLVLEFCCNYGSRAWTRWQDLRPGINALAPSPGVDIDPRPETHAAWAAVEPTAGSTIAIRVIGNPAAVRYPHCQQSYARNPWDLAAYAGQLYIGLGNADNEGPASNAGPVPVYAYDPVTDRVRQETTLPEEQIDRFDRRGDTLWIPGDDPRQSWNWGNLYRRSTRGEWHQFRTLPDTIHTYPLHWHDDRLFAGVSITAAVPEGVGTRRYGSAVAVSDDDGEQWRMIPLGGWRIFEFLPVQGRLYAIDIFPGPGVQRWLDREQRRDYYAPVYEYDGAESFGRRPDLTARQLFPDTPGIGARAAVIRNAVSWNDSAAYLGLSSRAEDGGPIHGAYLARDLAPGTLAVERLPLPADALAMDLRVDNDALQILFVQPLDEQRWQTTVWSSRDARNWTAELSFSAAAPARAFEKLDADWYFGLGSLRPPAPDGCKPADFATGTLLIVNPG